MHNMNAVEEEQFRRALTEGVRVKRRPVVRNYTDPKGVHTIEIDTEDCKTVKTALKVMKVALMEFEETGHGDVYQVNQDDVQRLIDGFGELCEYGGR